MKSNKAQRVSKSDPPKKQVKQAKIRQSKQKRPMTALYGILKGCGPSLTLEEIQAGKYHVPEQRVAEWQPTD